MTEEEDLRISVPKEFWRLMKPDPSIPTLEAFLVPEHPFRSIIDDFATQGYDTYAICSFTHCITFDCLRFQMLERSAFSGILTAVIDFYRIVHDYDSLGRKQKEFLKGWYPQYLFLLDAFENKEEDMIAVVCELMKKKPHLEGEQQKYTQLWNRLVPRVVADVIETLLNKCIPPHMCMKNESTRRLEVVDPEWQTKVPSFIPDEDEIADTDDEGE